MKVLILCGGFGTRLKPITEKVPKPMILLNGKPILFYLIQICQKNGFKDFIFATHYLSQKIINFFGNGKDFGVKIKYFCEKKPLGSAGAIKNAEKDLSNNFMVINGDTFIKVNLRKIVKFHHQKNGLGTLVVHRTSHPKDSDLVLFDKNKKIIFFGRNSFITKKTNLGNAGIFVFKKEIIKFIPKNKFYSIEKNLLPKLIKNKKEIYAYYTNEYIKDIGTFERLKEVEKHLKNL